MIEETIASIESRLRNAKELGDEQRAEMQALLERLKGELFELSSIDADQARSIVGYMDLSTHELARNEKQPHLLRLAIEGLSSSVVGLELKHPRLTEAINALCVSLANSGI